jgi:predicted adenylyl cyclase CyaB
MIIMEEKEFKILEVDQKKIVEKLGRLKAQKIFEGEILTLFLDFQDSRIQGRHDVLRLRKEKGEVDLTYKSVKVEKSIKVAEESSVKVSDIQMMLKILEKLGVSVCQKMNKHRISYKIDKVRFDIDCYVDKYGFIPAFLEIEGPAEGIKKYAQELGFKEKDCLPWSTDGLVAHYMEKARTMA